MFESIVTSMKINSPSRSKQKKANNDLLRNFSHKYTRRTEDTVSMNSKIKALKNDILIKNINQKGKLNIDIMNNPVLSNRFKEKIGELLNTTPSSLCSKNKFSKPSANINTDNTNFINREKELLSLINVDYDSIKKKNENKRTISPSKQKVNQLMKYLHKSSFLEQYKSNLNSRNKASIKQTPSIIEDTLNYDSQFSISKKKVRHQKTKSSLM